MIVTGCNHKADICKSDQQQGKGVEEKVGEEAVSQKDAAPQPTSQVADVELSERLAGPIQAPKQATNTNNDSFLGLGVSLQLFWLISSQTRTHACNVCLSLLSWTSFSNISFSNSRSFAHPGKVCVKFRHNIRNMLKGVCIHRRYKVCGTQHQWVYSMGGRPSARLRRALQQAIPEDPRSWTSK